MSRLIRFGSVFATLGGAAWTIKSIAIIALDRHFQPAEGVLYFVGVGGIVIGAVGFAAFISIRREGPTRWALFVLVLAVAIGISGVASSLVQTTVADAYGGGNVGVEQEMGILTAGLIWLAVGILLIFWRIRPSASSTT